MTSLAPSSRIVLGPKVKVEDVIGLLRKHSIRVAGGGRIIAPDGGSVGVVMIEGDPAKALEILTKADIEATTG